MDKVMQGAWMLVTLALLAGTAGAADFLVGSGQTYSTIQAAVDAARAAGAGTHTVRIMDSATYNESVKLDNAGFNSISLTIEADSGQTPTLHSFRTTPTTIITAMPGLTLRRLKFDESLLGAQTPALLGAVEIGLSARFTGNVTVESCTFTAAAATSWAVGTYCRMDNASYKVTVTNCDFYLSGATTLTAIDTYNGTNRMGLTVSDSVFIGSSSLVHYGIRDRNLATSGTAAMDIRGNLFYFLRAGFNNGANAPIGYITIENNTFVKCDGTASSFGSILITLRTAPTAIIKDNLVVSSGVNQYDGLVSGSTAVTDWDADYNAFVNMKNSYVGWWNAFKTVTDLNNLASADNNQLNNTLTPTDLFVNYGGTDYRRDYRLKSGVWALTAASDGSYVGAFGLERPTVTVTASDATAAEAGPDDGQYTVSRGSRTDGDLTVNYTLPVSGTATPGNGTGGDYTTTPAANYGARTGSVTIPDTATSATVTVTPVDDGDTELSETVVLLLAASTDYSIGSPSSNTVTIADNDVGGNLPPVVSAGVNKTIVSNSLPASAGLEGFATDADNGPTSPMTYQWAKVSGPGSVAFDDATVTNTTASFDTAGAYVLSLSAYDGAATRSNTVTITVYDNEAPTVDAGTTQSATLTTAANLDGTVTADDGLPPSSGLTYLWTQDSGPGTATFGNSTNIDTTVAFDQAGEYVLRLTATDGLGLSGSDTVTVSVRSNTVEFTAITSGRFNAAATWDAPGGVSGPPLAGDTANIGSSNTVTTQSGNEIGNQVIVNIGNTGRLRLVDPGTVAISPIHSGATVNVALGGTLEIQAENDVVGTFNLNGGTLSHNSATVNSTAGNLALGATLNINSNSFLSPISQAIPKINGPVHGSGSLTLTADAGTTSASIQFSAASTWSGAWDFQGNLRFSNGFVQRYIPGDERVASGKAVHFVSTTTRTIKGVRSGFGSDTFSGAGTNILGEGTGVLSPGDGVGGLGTVTMAATGTNSLQHICVFSSNSTYIVDINGTASNECDSLVVAGASTGAGKVQIVNGAILTVNLWTPPTQMILNTKIIDTRTGTGGDGVLTGSFSQINWVNASGWQNLGVTVVNGDLYVTGEHQSRGMLLLVE